MQNIEKYLINGEDAYNIYKLLYTITSLLEKNDINYWVTGGTFIGAVRSKGLLQWDDDIDLCIPYYYQNKVEEIVKQEKDLVYFSINSNYNHKIFYGNNKNTREYSYPFCDIFYTRLSVVNNKKAFIHANINALKAWPKEYFYLNDLVPLRKYQFGGYEVYGPKNYTEYMIRNYSSNWDKEGIIDCNHKTKNILNPKIKFKLCNKSNEPAKPFYFPSEEIIQEKKE